MQALIDFDDAPVFAIPVLDGTVREGMLIEGPQGWGEFSPPPECDDGEVSRWLTAAVEAGTVGWPDPMRGRVPVAVAVPPVGPARAWEIVAAAGCAAADVRVAARPGSLDEDIARLEAVRDALGPRGSIRADAVGGWDVDAALATIPALARAAGGLEFVEQPCPTVEELAAVRRGVDVPVAARAAPSAALREGADVVVLAVAPLGGVRRALRAAEAYGLPCVVSSAVQSSIGVAGGLALAGALPELPFACRLGTALLAGDLVGEGRRLIPTDGCLPVAPMPPAPDPDLVERFALSDPVRVSWWRARLWRAREYL